MAQVLNSVFAKLANPRTRPEVKVEGLVHLNVKTANILYAVAEAVLGAGFLKKCPRFIETVDDYLNYQRRSQREDFLDALTLAETPAFVFLAVGNLKGFSHLSIKERREVLEKLRSSDREISRNIYVGFVNVAAATYYASDLTWPDIGYKGVSVDHPEILSNPPPIPWRPDDPRPVDP